MDFDILQSGSNLSRRFVALHRFTSSQRPYFPWMASQRRGSSSPSSGDHYNSETTGASCWSPRTWQMDGNLGLRAEDAATQSFAPRDSGRRNRVRTRREVRLVGTALCRLKHNPAEATQASTTRQLRSEPRQLVVHLPASCSAFDQHRPASNQSMSRHRLSTSFFVL